VAILKDLSNNIDEINFDTTKKSQLKRLSISIVFVVFFGILKTLLRIVFSKAIKIYGSDKKHESKVWEKQLNNSDISEFGLILEQVAKDKIAKKNLLIGIPVSLATNHKRIKNGLGNFFAFVPLTIKQNKHIYLDLKTIKKRGEIIGTYLVSLLIGLLPLKIGKHFAKFISSHIYGVVSGVFVSSHVLEILGVKVNRINAWAPILEGQKFSVTTVAYNNQITVNELERV
jgi:hypothetical protein